MENKKIRLEVRKILENKLLNEQEIRMKQNIPVPADIMKIKNLFKKRGHKLFVVGGAVRDALLGKTPKDYDLATDAFPDTIQEILGPFYKTLETGKAFGIINVLTPSGEYEIATFRKDIGAGRRPDAVEFTTIDQDVKRRDLTINALFYDIDTQEVVDLVGGIEDLKNGVVRTVGSAEERFGEDRLRILRAIRFAGRFGSDLDPSVDAALKKDSRLGGFPETKIGDTVIASGNISGERIRDEFIKGIKSAKSVKQFLNMLDRYGLFNWIFPGLKIDRNYINKMQGDYNYDDYVVLLAHLLKENNIDSLRKSLNELKYSVDETKAITFLISLLNLDVSTAVNLKRAQKNSGVSNDQIRNFGTNEGIMSQLLDAFEKFNFTVKSQELMDQGFIGKALGSEIEKRETENFEKILHGN
jgi:tRNA nucleotidyltransferase/poly(A) polymerase